jgi:5-methylcytosine-specific restriction endonuclease McrA
MKSILHQSTVLVLNRNWQAIHVKTPAEAFCMMSTGAANGLDMQGNDFISPLKWDDWLKLAIRDEDQMVNTPRGAVRVPTVIVASNYSKIPLCRPRFGARGIWERDGGICQYTGRKLKPNEGNIDHIVPVSRGGKSTWDNCVLADKKVNEKKADRLPHEAGLRLLRKPHTPRALPATLLIRNLHGIPDWQRFLAPFSGHAA